jgi:hypothetical protein
MLPLIALTLIAAAEPPREADWLEARRMSIVLVNAELAAPAAASSDEPVTLQKEAATGLIVGWSAQTLTVITALHAVEDPEHVLKLQSTSVQLAPKICPTPSSATVSHVNRLLDLAVLTVNLPPDCSRNIRAGMLQPIRISPLVSAGAASTLEQASLYILARSTDGTAFALQLKDRATVVRVEEPMIMVQTGVLEPRMSGAPVFSETGELVGMAVKRESAEQEIAWVANYGAIRTALRHARVPFGLAGDVCDLTLKGYPLGSTVAVGDNPPEIIRDPTPVEPGTRMITVANSDGYAPAVGLVSLPNDGSVVRCVTLTRRSDRLFGRTRWWLLGGASSVVVAGLVVGGLALESHHQFDVAPTTTGYQNVQTENLAADIMLATGLAGLSIFGLGHVFWTPAHESSIHDCQ